MPPRLSLTPWPERVTVFGRTPMRIACRELLNSWVPQSEGYVSVYQIKTSLPPNLSGSGEVCRVLRTDTDGAHLPWWELIMVMMMVTVTPPLALVMVRELEAYP
eukprot:365924-Rhodomonas_salina.2